MPKTTLIIGNGFDINLGLKTSYSDFFNSQIFQDNKTKFTLLTHLDTIFSNQNWVDIEFELAKYSQSNKSDYNIFKNDFKNLCSFLKDYLSNQDLSTIKRNSGYILLEKLLENELTVIDFNYTGTVEYIAKELNLEKNLTHFQVHGSLKDNNIIFGVQDEININGNVFIRKSFHENYGIYDIDDALRNSEKIIIFGYSLGDSDHMYFSRHFQSLVMPAFLDLRQILDIFYYNEKDSIFQQLEILTMREVGKVRINHELHFISA